MSKVDAMVIRSTARRPTALQREAAPAPAPEALKERVAPGAEVARALARPAARAAASRLHLRAMTAPASRPAARGRAPGPRAFDLFAHFFRREATTRYLGSVTGLAWAFVHPLALLVVYHFVFTTIFRTDRLRQR